MKTIGLIGGMSWESTVSYYQIINRVMKEQLGGLHSAKCLLYSVDFHEIEECQAMGEWDKSGTILAKAAKDLENGGADFIVICTNTMHKVVDMIQKAVTIPILHIAEVTADELMKHSITKVALLGTKYTMEQDFYKDKIIQRGIEVVIPNSTEVNKVNSIIYDELCKGIILESSKADLIKVIGNLEEEGIQGVILGCTEIGLLVKQSDTKVPLFDTTLIHAKSAANYSLH